MKIYRSMFALHFEHYLFFEIRFTSFLVTLNKFLKAL